MKEGAALPQLHCGNRRWELNINQKLFHVLLKLQGHNMCAHARLNTKQEQLMILSSVHYVNKIC